MLKATARMTGREQHQKKTLLRGHGGTTAGLGRDRFFNIYCKLEPTSEKFMLNNICLEMKIKDLKSYTEFITGIPVNLQRLCYLDEGDLLEHTDVRHNDIVPGALLHMNVWNTWRTLVEAVVSGDSDRVFSLGVTANADFKSPTSDYMAGKHPKMKQQWLEERAFVALYIASHRGNQRLCSKLVESGANVNARTPYGRSPLHVAAARGHGNIVDLLLEKGADIDAADNNGETPLTVAEKFGNKVCERHLFLFRWQQRAKQTLKNKMQVDMFAHQYFDSINPVWLKGKYGQIYLTQILPPGEYEGTAFNAPLRRPRLDIFADDDGLITSSDSDSEGNDDGEGEMYQLDNVTRRQTRRHPQHPNVMPAIKEETSSNYVTDDGERSQRKGISKRHKTKIPGARSFDEWLNQKKAVEQTKIRIKKKTEQEKQVVLEEKKKEMEMKKSFNDWLEKIEAGNKIVSTPAAASATIDKGLSGTTTAEIIEKIMDKRQDQYNDHDNPSNLWQSLGENNFYRNMKSKGGLLAKQYD